MEPTNKALQGLGIPYAALISIIFGMMILSFPLGAYLVFNSQIGNDINFEFPISGFDFFLAGIGYEIPIEFELGDAFIVIWGIFIILFAISIFGPKKDFLKTLVPIMTEGKKFTHSNYLVSMITWFSVLILVSAIINFIQEGIGITTEPPLAENDLIQFFEMTKAPIVEEIGFRVLLIGVPLFAIYSHKSSAKQFFKSLWHPFENLHVENTKKAIALIVLVAIFFGIAHIISGELWSSGKFAQATASGIIIGWVYFRYGFAPAVLIHWATNYFIFSYVFIIADINFITVKDAFSHSLINTLEIMLVLSGIVSVGILLLSYIYSKKEKNFENKVVSNAESESLERIDSYSDESNNPKTFVDSFDEDSKKN